MTERTHIPATNSGKPVSIPVEAVLYFRADCKCVEIHHTGSMSLTFESLRSLHREFGERFVRSNRKVLAAVRWINAIEKTDNGRHVIRVLGRVKPIDVSRRNLARVRRALGVARNVPSAVQS